MSYRHLDAFNSLLLGPDVTTFARLVMERLCWRANYITGICWPGLKDLAMATGGGGNRGRVLRTVKFLESLRLIGIKKDIRRGSPSNTYCVRRVVRINSSDPNSLWRFWNAQTVLWKARGKPAGWFAPQCHTAGREGRCPLLGAAPEQLLPGSNGCAPATGRCSGATEQEIEQAGGTVKETEQAGSACAACSAMQWINGPEELAFRWPDVDPAPQDGDDLPDTENVRIDD